MKQKIIKITSLFISITMVVVMLPTFIIGANAISQSDFEGRLSNLRNQYPDYSTWYDSFDGGTQCYGFARLVAYEVFGSHVYDWGVSYSMDGVKAGDVLQYGPTSGSGHTVFVTSVSGNTITFVDCNGNGNYSGGTKVRTCGIKWDNTISTSGAMYGRIGFSYRHISPEIEPQKPDIIIPTGSQTISDGEYHIVSVLDENKGIDVQSGSVDNGANIDLYPNLNDAKQVFNITYLGDGSYKIINQHSGRSLDCAEAGTTAGTNLQQWDYGNASHQQWIIQETGDGESFFITSKKSGLRIDVDNASTEDFTNLKLFTPYDTNAQKWKFIAWGGNVGKTISDGDYHISSMLNPSMCLDVYAASKDNSANIDVYDNIQTPEQVFTVTYLGDGYYKIVNKNSGKSLDLQDKKCVAGTNIQQYDYSDDNQKKWIIKPTSDGKSFNIISKKGGLCVDINGGRADNFTNVQGYIANGTEAQNWRFIAWNNTSNEIPEGEYRIVSALDENKAIDIFGANTENFANVDLYSNLTDAKQIFKITKSNGHYIISSSHANRALDVADKKCTNGANVHLYDYNQDSNQEWILQPTDDGYYSIISHASGMALEAEGGNSENGTNIQMWIQNGTNAQKWKLRRILKDEMISVSDCIVIGNKNANPEISVNVGEKELVENVDYTVQITTDAENGSGNATITGLGYYCDSVTKSFSIQSRKIGDTNLDGNINVRDVTAIQRHLVELETFTEDQLAVVDTNGDGEINIADATHLQMYLAEYDVALGKQ